MVAVGLFAGAIYVPGQTSSHPLSFEVASVKPNVTGRNGIGNQFGPDSVRWTNAPLSVLIEETYGLKHYQVLGGPAWLESDRWDIDAKSAGPATAPQQMAMMGTLLAERFQLRFHRETKQLPIYRLAVRKGSPKLVAAKEGERGSAIASEIWCHTSAMGLPSSSASGGAPRCGT